MAPVTVMSGNWVSYLGIQSLGILFMSPERQGLKAEYGTIHLAFLFLATWLLFWLLSADCVGSLRICDGLVGHL